jgi:hypothetical protein
MVLKVEDLEIYQMAEELGDKYGISASNGITLPKILLESN